MSRDERSDRPTLHAPARSARVARCFAPRMRGSASPSRAVLPCSSPAARKTRAPPKRPPVPVTVAEARRETTPIDVAATGTVESRSTVEVRSRVGGEVVRVALQRGRRGRARPAALHHRPAAVPDRPRPGAGATSSATGCWPRTPPARPRATPTWWRRTSSPASSTTARRPQARALQAGLAADRAAVAEARLQLDYANGPRSPIDRPRRRACWSTPATTCAPTSRRWWCCTRWRRSTCASRSRSSSWQRCAAATRPAAPRRWWLEELVGKVRTPTSAGSPSSTTRWTRRPAPSSSRPPSPTPTARSGRASSCEVSLRLGDEQAVVAPEGAVQSGQHGDLRLRRQARQHRRVAAGQGGAQRRRPRRHRSRASPAARRWSPTASCASHRERRWSSSRRRHRRSAPSPRTTHRRKEPADERPPR